jgi:hypothetical protein
MNTFENSYPLNDNRELVDLLFGHCRELFSRYHLPSHDHLHHLRVWNYATDLLSELSESGIVLDNWEIRQLLLSVFFHDTGLTITLEEDHGSVSRKLCEDFITRHPGLFPGNNDPALLAIELHDRKQSPPESPADASRDILKILSVCDDADAYGPAGVLRYAEIYLLRGITTEELPAKVLVNMDHRFNFFTSLDWIPGMFFSRHKSRYEYAADYYKVLREKPHPREIGLEYMEIINSYMEEVYRGKLSMKDFAIALSNSTVKEKRCFGSELLTELQSGPDLIPAT